MVSSGRSMHYLQYPGKIYRFRFLLKISELIFVYLSTEIFFVIIVDLKFCRWPYPFLDVSTHLAPRMLSCYILTFLFKRQTNRKGINALHYTCKYIVVGLLQVPCYLAFMVALILKCRLFARWFPAMFIQGVAVGAMIEP
jgi:hypothetical protein